MIDLRVITAHDLYVLQDHLQGEYRVLIYLDAPARECRLTAVRLDAVRAEAKRRWQAVKQSISA